MSRRCSAKSRNGKRCGAWAVTGATQCALHADQGLRAALLTAHLPSADRIWLLPLPGCKELPPFSLAGSLFR